MDYEIVKAVVPAVFAAGGAYWAVRTELNWLRSDVNDLKNRIRELETKVLRNISVG